VTPCAARLGRWLIALSVTHIGEKELTDPIDALFLVQDLGSYHYRMESVSDSAPEGCPGEGNASDKHPWLSDAELKALR